MTVSAVMLALTTLAAQPASPAGTAGSPAGTPPPGAASPVAPSFAPESPPAPPQSGDADQLARILSLMESHLSWLQTGLAVLATAASLVIVALGVVGFREAQALKRLRADAERAVTEAVRKANEASSAAAELERQARHASEQARRLADSTEAEFNRIRQAAAGAMADVDAAFETLPRFEEARDPDDAPPPVPAEVSLSFEDADVLLVLCDRLRLLDDPARTAGYFRKIGRYWRVVGNYPRSLARLERAVVLDAGNAENHWLLGQTLARQAGTKDMPADQKRPLLERARASIENAVARMAREDPNTFQEIAWISFEMGEFAAAAEAFRKARDLDRSRVQRDGGEPDWVLTYNLACSLAKSGRHAEGLAALAEVAEHCREQAWNESAFAEWTGDPWRERFERLVGRRVDPS